MTRCSAIGCVAPATDYRDITMPSGAVVRADYCPAHADSYDIALRDIEARNAEDAARREATWSAIYGR